MWTGGLVGTLVIYTQACETPSKNTCRLPLCGDHLLAVQFFISLTILSASCCIS